MIRSQHGFSLLEVLVAFSITAATLGMLYQVYAKGSTAVSLAEDYAEAQVLAESQLAGVSASEAMPSLEVQGTYRDKYDWEMRIEGYGGDNQESAPQPSYSLALVEVNVSWHNRGRLHRVDLQTLKPVVRSSTDDK